MAGGSSGSSELACTVSRYEVVIIGTFFIMRPFWDFYEMMWMFYFLL